MTKVAVFGATGYGGVELVRILLEHPEVEIVYLGGHTTVGQRLAEFYPHLAGAIDMEIGETDVAAAGEADLMFFALPHAVGAELVAEALEMGKQVVDFSADYRLKSAAVYEQYYEAHPRPELLERAVYGLPELHREEIAAAQLTAVPGCYPTGAILALAPAAVNGLIEPDVIVDAKSGVSGAGRTPLSLTTHYPECNESVAAYKIAQHRHGPEMVQELSALGEPVTVTFTPHLIPMNRGILSTCYGTLTREITLEEAVELYREFYAGEPFVRVLPAGSVPATKHVSGSNFCDIGLAVDADAGRLIAVSAIDNLVKGLSGAAVQCMNLMLGVDETAALSRYAIWP
ncbi:MAG: N-acetyl-gamma-glutamyl-phosphate reductase [Armatimonadota bacterium]|nr:N-acetyl-gamma-glutamyl-phosphate reductase [Armatimonadota bacterium]